MDRDRVIGGLAVLKAFFLHDQPAQEILDGARELLKDQPDWISCDDQLPVPGEMVLTLTFVAFMAAPPVVIRPPELLPVVVMVVSLTFTVVPVP